MTDFTAARESMVYCQVHPSDVTRYSIIEAMLAIPRERFVPKGSKAIAYAGTEIEVAPGRFLMEPRVFGKMLEAAAIGPEDLVLDIACATGYSTAVIARMAEAVVATDPDKALVTEAQRHLSALEIDNATVVRADPAEGNPAHGPYDAIIVNGGVERIPDALIDQLRDGGRLVAVFTDRMAGQCRLLQRSGHAISERIMFDATAPVLDGFEKPETFVF